ncbi:MAG: hypothetical protein H8E26_15620 [FCB group bacterium]|nr:hypothetical protein [FCB group bacterium]
MGYKFTLSEYHPVVKVQLEENNTVSFWYNGGDLDLPPMKTIDGNVSDLPWQDEVRPGLTGAAVNILRDQGEEACINHINRRIANYILDQYEAMRDNCPLNMEKQYLTKIDEFYLWFWHRRHSSNDKIFARFLRHIHSIRQKTNPPPTWYTLKEAGNYTRAGVTKLREMIDAGKLRSYRLDDAKSKSTIILHRKDLDAIILFDRSSGLSARQQENLKSYQK